MSDLDKLIANAGDAGWEFFESLFPPAGSAAARKSALSPEQVAQAEKCAHAWAGFAATDGGRAAIEHLKDITLDRAVYTAALGLPMDAAYGHGCLREGQNAIVHLILKMIAQGRKEAKPQERTST